MMTDHNYRFVPAGNRSGKTTAARQQLRPEHRGGLIANGQAKFFDDMEFAKKLKKYFTVKELVAAGISRSAAYAYRGPYAFPNEKNRKVLEKLLAEKMEELGCPSTTTDVQSATT
jgi:hypothetical protein